MSRPSRPLLDWSGEPRPPELRIHDDEIIADCFAGGGGASLGIEMALGRSAINHDAEAIAMHKANHPNTEHYIEDIYDVDPASVCRGKPVGLAWFSPDCVEHSRAKNGALVRSKKVRCLANVIHRWAAAVRPRVILLENVTEWESWGPLDETGKIDKTRKGEDFKLWWERLEHMGYRLSLRTLKACDYGAPTSRNRLYIIARCDGIDPGECWPEATHGPGKPLPWRTAAECIDYSLPCPSIFMTKAEAKAFRKATGIACKRPLADKTMLRIRRGIYKYVLNNAKPFIVPVSHGGVGRTDHRVHGAGEPLRTVTGANRGEFALVQPMIASYYGEGAGGDDRCRTVDHPMPTATTSPRFALVTPFIAPVKTWGGGGNEPRDIALPHRTITTSKRGEFALVQPFVMPNNTNNVPKSVDSPVPTITTGNRNFLVAPYLARTAHGEVSKSGRRRGKGAHEVEAPLPTICASSVDYALVAPTLVQTGYGERDGQAPRCLDIGKPIGTIVSGGTGGTGKHALVAAFLSKGYSERETGGWNGGSSMEAPTGSITTKDHHNLVLGHMVKFRGTSDSHVESSSFPASEPVPTASAGGNHIGEVRAFLSKYGNGTPESLLEPLDTVTTKDRFGLVMVEGQEYQIVDIGMRMLEPRELFRAQGFPDTWIIDPVCTRTISWVTKKGRTVTRTITGPLTETAQVEKCGNSVSPPVACAIVRSVFSVAAMPIRKTG